MLQSESAAQAPADPEGPGARRAFWPETAFWALGEQFPPVALMLKIAKRVPICWHARHLRALRAVGRVGCKGLGDGGVGALVAMGALLGCPCTSSTLQYYPNNIYSRMMREDVRDLEAIVKCCDILGSRLTWKKPMCMFAGSLSLFAS